jgi:hypothetical protein
METYEEIGGGPEREGHPPMADHDDDIDEHAAVIVHIWRANAV